MGVRGFFVYDIGKLGLQFILPERFRRYLLLYHL